MNGPYVDDDVNFLVTYPCSGRRVSIGTDDEIIARSCQGFLLVLVVGPRDKLYVISLSSLRCSRTLILLVGVTDHLGVPVRVGSREGLQSINRRRVSMAKESGPLSALRFSIFSDMSRLRGEARAISVSREVAVVRFLAG